MLFLKRYGVVMFLFIIAFITTLTALKMLSTTFTKSATLTKVATQPVLEPATFTSSEATIGMIGDILLHNPIYTYGDFNFAFERVKPQLEAIDFLLANQESMPAGHALGLSDYPIFNSPPHIIRDLQLNGVDFLTLANNHTLDKGEQQVLLSLRNLNHYNMPYAGAFSSAEDKAQPRIMMVNTIAVGVLAYTYGTNTFGTTHPDNKDYLVSYLEPQQVIEDIKELRPKTDFIVLSLHWGKEYHTANTDEQRELAKSFFGAGADAIFGHHPHVLQPFEWIDGKPVFYSLGNFYSAQPWPATNVGGIGRITITKTVTNEVSETKTTDANFFPTTVVRDVYTSPSTPAAFRVLPLKEFDNQMGWDVNYVEQHLGLTSW